MKSHDHLSSSIRKEMTTPKGFCDATTLTEALAVLLISFKLLYLLNFLPRNIATLQYPTKSYGRTLASPVLSWLRVWMRQVIPQTYM